MVKPIQISAVDLLMFKREKKEKSFNAHAHKFFLLYIANGYCSRERNLSETFYVQNHNSVERERGKVQSWKVGVV